MNRLERAVAESNIIKATCAIEGLKSDIRVEMSVLASNLKYIEKDLNEDNMDEIRLREESERIRKKLDVVDGFCREIFAQRLHIEKARRDLEKPYVKLLRKAKDYIQRMRLLRRAKEFIRTYKGGN